MCLKIDSASKYDRSILGINIQFLLGSKIVVRTLGMIEVTKRHTSENLKAEILGVLSDYNIDLSKILCITTANMIKAVALLKNILDVTEIDDKTMDIVEDDEEGDDEAEEVQDNESGFIEPNDQLHSSIFVNSVRCASHTLQLAIHDVLKQYAEKIKEIRQIIKKLKKHPYRNAFSANSKRKSFLDVPTRWSSCYEMVNCLFTQKEFIVNLISEDRKLNIYQMICGCLWNYLLRHLSQQ